MGFLAYVRGPEGMGVPPGCGVVLGPCWTPGGGWPLSGRVVMSRVPLVGTPGCEGGFGPFSPREGVGPSAYGAFPYYRPGYPGGSPGGVRWFWTLMVLGVG